MSVTKEGLVLEETEEEKARAEEQKTAYEPLCNRIKKFWVVKLKRSLLVLVSSSLLRLGHWSIRLVLNMERIMKAQALRDKYHGQLHDQQKDYEINPNHPIISTLKERFESIPMTQLPLIWSF